MVIRILEECETSKGEKGIRKIIYKTKANNLLDAHMEFEKEFDFDNIIETDDYFEGECNNSITISVEKCNELFN